MFKIMSEGNVYLDKKKDYTYFCPRTATMPDGNILCCFTRSKNKILNDFVPFYATSASGEVWSEAKPVWPDIATQKAIVATTPRTTPDGRIALAGMISDIAGENDVWWSNELCAMKANKVFWCVSPDGRNFPPPTEIELPDAAAAEQPGGILVKNNGEMLMVYSPCPAIESKGPVTTNRQVLLRSKNGGINFFHQYFGEIEHPVLYAESWIVELGNGKLMTCSWITGNEPFADVYFLSDNGGDTFEGPFEMPFKGQTTSLTPYKDDYAFIAYNQREYGTTGVWLAFVKIQNNAMTLLANEPVWKTSSTMINNKNADFENFTDYAFGEPQVTILRDGSLFLVFWFDQPHGTGIHYVKLQGDF